MKRVLTLILVALLFTGCFGPSQLQRSEWVENHPEIAYRYKDAIERGVVVQGMTPEMVRASWGDPIDINTTVTMYSTSEQWVYPGRSYIYFEDGRVTGWQQ